MENDRRETIRAIMDELRKFNKSPMAHYVLKTWELADESGELSDKVLADGIGEICKALDLSYRRTEELIRNDKRVFQSGKSAFSNEVTVRAIEESLARCGLNEEHGFHGGIPQMVEMLIERSKPWDWENT